MGKNGGGMNLEKSCPANQELDTLSFRYLPDGQVEILGRHTHTPKLQVTLYHREHQLPLEG